MVDCELQPLATGRKNFLARVFWNNLLRNIRSYKERHLILIIPFSPCLLCALAYKEKSLWSQAVNRIGSFIACPCGFGSGVPLHHRKGFD